IPGTPAGGPGYSCSATLRGAPLMPVKAQKGAVLLFKTAACLRVRSIEEFVVIYNSRILKNQNIIK
ncbi:MAG: hypothetical protein K2M00_04025, partial [Muribaculaceae bacterium]|nr:hypothetical protein [Muribaculaceae bacterium]